MERNTFPASWLILWLHLGPKSWAAEDILNSLGGDGEGGRCSQAPQDSNIWECVKAMNTVEKSVSMCDLVFLNRSEQPLDCGKASCLVLVSGRKELQFHL